MSETYFGGDRILSRIVQTLVKKVSLSLQFEIANVSVPVCNGAPAPTPCMQIDASHSERRRNARGGRLAVGAKRFTIEVQLRVEHSRSPTGKHLLDCRFIDSQETGERAQIRSERHDGTDV